MIRKLRKSGNFFNTARLQILMVVALLWPAYYAVYGQAGDADKLYQDGLTLKREHKFKEALEKLIEASVILETERDKIPYMNCKLEISRIYRIRGNYDSALFILDTINILKDNYLISDKEITATVNYEYAVTYLEKGEIEKGKEHITEAIRLYEQLYGKDDTTLAPAYNKMGNYYFYKKDFNAALSYYDKAYNLVNEIVEDKSSIASYAQNIGIIHVELGDYQKAEYFFQKTLNALISSPPSDNTVFFKAYTNLGKFYYNLSIYDKALTYLDQAEHLIVKDFDKQHSNLSIVFWNKGLIYYMQGDYDRSILLLNEARRLIELNHSKNSPFIPSINMDIALAYEALGNDTEALAHYQLSLLNAPIPLQIKVYRNLAKFYLFKDNLPKARHYIDLCLKITQESGYGNNYENANTLMRYGQILNLANDPQALQQYRASIALYQQTFGSKHRDIALVKSLIGDYYFKQSQIDSALLYYHKSIISITPEFNDTIIFNNPHADELPVDLLTISFLANKAAALHLKYQNSGSFDHIITSVKCYDLSIYLLEQFSRSYRAEESKVLLTNTYYGNYQDAISINLTAYDQGLDMHYLNNAFMISEKSKAAILLAELKDENARNLGMIPNSLIELEKTIRKNLYMYKTNIYQAERNILRDDTKINILRSALFTWEERYDSLIRIFQNTYSDYYRLKFDQSVITLQELQKVLSPDEILLEYSLSDNELFSFLISSNQFRVIKSSIDTNFLNDIFTLRENLKIMEIQNYSYKDYIQYQEIAHKLYNILIKPFSEFITGKHVIIIPDGALAYLSFESLLKDKIISDTISFRRLPYFIKDNSISYASSSTIYSIAKKKRRPRLRSGVLALAPTYTNSAGGMSDLEAFLTDYPVGRKDLPGALKEVEIIMNIMNGLKLIGNEATEANFKKHAGNYDILHFAMHTRINDENPLSSRLSFYPLRDSTEDDVLYTYEIYNMRLKGHMAVLSACSTGGGKLQKGEGVISLARAFAYAGMPSILMTLWDVEDYTSGYIIPFFYQFLSSGYHKGEALRQAKLKYLENARLDIETHPAFWSAFVLYGNPESFRQTRIQSLTIYLLVLSLLIIIILFILTRKYIDFKKNRNNYPEQL